MTEVAVPSRAVSEIRVRTQLPPGAMEERWRKVGTEDDYDFLVTGPARVLKPDGKLLCQVLPKAFSHDRMADFYDALHSLRTYETSNRGYASGTESLPRFKGATRIESVPVKSAIIGHFEASPPKFYCRLTAFNSKEIAKFESLVPMFETIGDLFRELVPDRFATQMEYVRRTHPDWIIRGTPFTTITVNNSYPTGYHTDKGDLEEGFSNVTALRRGNYTGGVLVFPEYRVAADLHDGDTILMDAHAAHGNTMMTCGDCGHPMGPAAGDWNHEKNGCTAERISVVCYYRTKFTECGSPEEEAQKAAEWGEKRAAIAEDRTLEEMASEAYN